MKSTLPLIAVATVSAALLAGAGCAAQRVALDTAPAEIASTQSATTAQASADLGVDFWYALARKRNVTNDEATRALLSHLDDAAAHADYPARIERLKARRLLPTDFSAGAEANVRRGDLAVALCRALKIDGGLTARIAGLTPRYATRALVFEGIYPESTPNQSFTGAEFVGVIGALDDRRRGNPADVPAEEIPGLQEPRLAMDGPPTLDYRLEPLVYTQPAGDAPVYLMMQDGAAQPAGATTQGAPRKLRVFVTAVQDPAEFRRNATAPWEKARVGLVLDENAEFRTGDKGSIRFNIPPGQTFTLDRLGSCKVAEAAFDGNKVKTTVGLEQGRVRMDINPTGAASKSQIEKVDFDSARMAEAGVVHDTQIRSPNSALAVRGTRVSLLDQPPYAPLATSLTGRAEYLNTRRQAVAFGAAGARAQVQGDESSAADSSARRSRSEIPPAAGASAFDAAQLNRVLSTGGFLRGDVVVGNASVDPLRDFAGVPLVFLLQFGSENATNFQDLNLAVVTPRSTTTTPDFVANGPFTQALNPKTPGYEAYRAANYPKTSPSGGAISRNAVSVPPQFATSGGSTFFRASEAASFPQADAGSYRVAVYNFIDVPDGTSAPGRGSDPVPYRLSVLLNGRLLLIDANDTGVGLFETRVYDLDGFTTTPDTAAGTRRLRNAALPKLNINRLPAGTRADLPRANTPPTVRAPINPRPVAGPKQ